MNLTTLTDKINTVFEPKTLFTLAREHSFVKRHRQINPQQLLLSFIETLGCQAKANLADIHRNYIAHSGMEINYKPFHNQIKKEQCAKFFENAFQMTLSQWVLDSLKLTSLSTGEKFPFSEMKLHDGCSFKVHNGLNKTYPGRFKKHSPAAIELHVTMDLLSSGIDYLSIGADTEAERPHAPKPTSLKDKLLLTDAGYFERQTIIDIDKQGGNIITQALCSINPLIQAAYDYDGNQNHQFDSKRLKDLKLKDKNSTIDLNVRWPEHPFDFRVIAFWYKKKKRIGYLVTNLPRDSVPASDVVELYRLRWQIELLFKELKSYCNLKKFSTKNQHIVKTLIYASFITVLLKRLMAYSTELLKSLWISTQKTARTAPSWLSLMAQKIMQSGQLTQDVLLKSVEMISRLCQRAHPKRDLKDGLYQFGVISLVENHTNG